MKQKNLRIGTLLFILVFTGCQKFVTIPPPNNQLTSTSVFENQSSATTALTGIYTTMMYTYGFASGATSSTTKTAGLGADELVDATLRADNQEFYLNQLTPTNATLTGQIWNEIYKYIFFANSAIDGLANSKSLTDSFKVQLRGEAEFVRAFCYFYLVNCFGDVPLYTTPNYQLNEKSFRTSVSQVYGQIESDLEDAQNTLLTDYSTSGGQRVRPNSWVATALLSRVYLYQQKWDSAEAEATKVINNTSLFNLVSLDSVFLMNSNEAIWQLLPVQLSLNTNEGQMFILKAPPTDVFLDSAILTKFESGDARLTNWISSYSDGISTWYYPFKYKIQASQNLTEYSMVIRLAELYLIRAEARAHLNDFSGAQADLNMIRTRASLPNTTANDQPSLLLAIEHERQVELFTEWGHRWFDLVRTGRANTVLGAKKPTWSAHDTLYPIPSIEIQNNQNITQNVGY